MWWAMLVLCLGRPATVAVDVDALALPHAQTEQLHGEMMTRLVEAGHAVGSHGAVVVRVTGSGSTIHVEVAHGHDVRMRDVHGEGALLRLAAIHAAIELLAGIDAIRVDPDPVLAAAPDRAVVLEVDDAVANRTAEAIVAVVDAGHVVTPDVEGASRRVCIGEQDGAATLRVVAIDAPCEPGDPAPMLAADIAAALQTVHRAPPEPSRPAPVSSPPPERPSPPPLAPVDPTPLGSPWSGAVGVGLGVQGRLRTAEPLVLVHGDARHRSGAWITGRLATAPSRDDDVAVADTFITAGAGYGRGLGRRVRLELALAGGVVIHGYHVAGDRGARVDPTAELPVALAVALGDRIELMLAVVSGVSARARSHERGSEVLWSRDRWRLGAMLGMNVVLGRKPAGRSSAGGT
jgi:hypothetical protein